GSDRATGQPCPPAGGTPGHRTDLHHRPRARARHRRSRGRGHRKRRSMSENERNYRKSREGLVIGNKMDKTIVVDVEDRVKHSLYGKVLRRTGKLKAHDEQNECGV